MSYTEEDEAHTNRILSTKNFYEILQVPNDATNDQIKSAYKNLVLLVHPDRNNAPRAKEAFIAVRRATAVLLDKSTRREYDESRGVCADKFELSDEAIDAIFITAGIVGVVGIAAGLVSLYNYFTSPKKEDRNEPKYAK